MGSCLKRRIVLSGVNFVEAGPLAIFKDALEALSGHGEQRFEVIALVHRRDLFELPGIRYLEFPKVKTSWMRRLYFEYIQCRKLSRELDADLWLSMHDITASVTAKIQAVYCHNPAPFYKISARDLWLDPRFAAFHFLYALLYRINIKRNDAVVVQQQWMREEFQRQYKPGRIVVAHPSLTPPALVSKIKGKLHGEPIIFFYPAFPRCFKNIESLLAAAAELSATSVKAFEVWITITGEENRYSRSLYKQFGTVSCIRWMGALSRERVQEVYSQADCLVFPSRLETWGLPLSEFTFTRKPILAIDQQYAHETLGEYPYSQFFSASGWQDLSGKMSEFLNGNLTYRAPALPVVAKPFVSGWLELFEYLLMLRPSHVGWETE